MNNGTKIKVTLKKKDYECIQLPQGFSWLRIYSSLPSVIQMDDTIFERIWNLHPAELGKGQLFGKPVTFQRYEQAFGHDYYYGGDMHHALPLIDPYLQTLLAWVCEHSKLPYQGLLINWYQDGNHYIGEHSDKEKSLVPLTPIYSFSFGQNRDFVVRSKDKAERKVIHMNHNSLIIMGGEMQQYYKHSVPVRALSTCPKPRINMTFRLFQ